MWNVTLKVNANFQNIQIERNVERIHHSVWLVEDLVLAIQTSDRFLNWLPQLMTLNYPKFWDENIVEY